MWSHKSAGWRSRAYLLEDLLPLLSRCFVGLEATRVSLRTILSFARHLISACDVDIL